MKTTKRIPKFNSAHEEARFWETHSVADYLHELKEAHNIKFPKPRKRLISVRMDETQIKPLKEIAAAKGIGYLTLIRMWIAERLSRERGLLHTHRG